jgi:hypothetical protein
MRLYMGTHSFLLKRPDVRNLENTPPHLGIHIPVDDWTLEMRGCFSFDPDALALLHQATHGAMRDLDRLATDSLRLAALKKRRLIDRALVSQILTLDASDPAA